MKFILVEKFNEQPLSVQNNLLDWWKMECGDLYIQRGMYDSGDPFATVMCINELLEGDIEGLWNEFKEGVYPLFTEDNLRNYIQEKVDCLLSVESSPKGFIVKGTRYSDNSNTLVLDCNTHKSDLLEVYWVIACELANSPKGFIFSNFKLEIL